MPPPPPPHVEFETTLVHEGALCAIPLDFDPKAMFGTIRAPVKVTLNGYTYQSTIASMGGRLWIPLRKSHRESAGLKGDETLRVRVELDTTTRTVTPPDDLVTALKAAPHAWERWQALSYSHQREYVEAIQGAKKPETRTRRIESAVRVLGVKTGVRP